MLLHPAGRPGQGVAARQLVGGREELWQLAANIFLYAIDKQNLRNKRRDALVARDER